MHQNESIKVKRKRAPMLHYSESLKRAVCQEYLLGQKSGKNILKEYGVRFNGAIRYWMRELNYDGTERKRVLCVMKKKSVQKSDSDKKKIQAEPDQSARIKELERQLQDSQLR